MVAPLYDFDCVKKAFNLPVLQDFQMETLTALLNKRDAFVSVKTGGGKSLCYQGFATAFEDRHRESCSVLVVSPLLSIMDEQCKYLESLGFSAAYIGCDSAKDEAIANNTMQFVFTSPESLLCGKWREWLTNNTSIRLIAIDEAHTVLHWGQTTSEEDPFRIWYGKLGEVRSLIECPLLLLTATANLAARRVLQRKFCMKDCLEIIQNPDRENIKLFVTRVKLSTPLEDTFHFVITLLKQNKKLCERILIFCPTIRLCSKIFTMFRMALKQDISFVEMYHSKTPDDVKQLIKDDMVDPGGNIRIVLATSAAGMGVNFCGVKYVINYGCPRDMDMFVQQFGRAGRNGDFAMSLIIYTKRDLKNIDSDMKLYIENDASSLCRREILLSAYKCKPREDRNIHMCCDICTRKCEIKNCENCTLTLHPYFKTQLPSYSSESSDDSNIFSDSDS